ncbi:MAG: efflux RND transporter periplasmic adaptor subunit [Salinivirgaceae bacterium]|nr:efflux RND transporter periplasmic adaptor subunit [Salinivirgaceae bacterium]
MKTFFKILPIVILFASCSESNDQAIKNKIIQKKQQIAKFEHEITALEKQLTDTTVLENLIPVSVKEIKPEAFNHYFVVFGNAEADEYGMISPEMNGKVEKIHVQEGQKVDKGTLLMTLNTAAIQQQINAMEANLELTNTSYNKQKALWDQKIGSEIQYLQAKAAKDGLEAQLQALKAQLYMSQIRAPYSGIVNKIYPKVGEMASPQFPAIEFVNLSNITVRTNISEKYISKVHKGQMVDLSFSALPDFNEQIVINRVSNVINSKSRTFEVELQLKNENDQIKPNLVSTIRINDFSTNDAFVIPSLVIKKDISNDYVYVVTNKKGKSIVEKRAIQLGLSYQDKTMITKGLKSGDKVVVKGYNMVSNGIPVSVK